MEGMFVNVSNGTILLITYIVSVCHLLQPSPSSPHGYWTTRGVDKSRTGQLADAIDDFACLVFLFGGICETASCPVRDLSSPRVD